MEVSQADKFVWIERDDRLALTFKVPIIFVAVGSQNVIVFYLKMSNILLKNSRRGAKKAKKKIFPEKRKIFSSPLLGSSLSVLCLYLAVFFIFVVRL